MEAYARALAEEHFYADVDDHTPWEPFEHWDEVDIAVEVDTLADAVEQAMRWVQDGEKT